MIPMACYWLICLFSMLWTENKAEGWQEVNRITWFLVFPLVYAITDFRELKHIHLRSVLWLYVACMMVLFLIVTTKLILHGNLEQYNYHNFHDLHHCYMAVYLLTGLAFLYAEFDRLIENKGNKHDYIYMVVSFIILIAFVILINSRTGILGVLLLFLICWMHLIFERKRYRMAIITLVAFPLLVAVLYCSLPDTFHRLSNTIEKNSQGEEDIRITIAKNSWIVLKDNMIFGVGAGDRMDMLAPQYVLENGEQGEVRGSHNQYLDTWLTLGIMGIAALFAVLFIPMIHAWSNKRFFMFSTLFVFAVSILFESMLERQMGIIYFGVMMLLFAIDEEIRTTKGSIAETIIR